MNSIPGLRRVGREGPNTRGSCCSARVACAMLRVLGRAIFSVVFLWSAVHCIRHGVEAEDLAARGVPVGPSTVYVVAVLSAVATLLLLCNLHARVGATLLALLLVPTAYIVDVIPLSVVRGRQYQRE